MYKPRLIVNNIEVPGIVDLVPGPEPLFRRWNRKRCTRWTL